MDKILKILGVVCLSVWSLLGLAVLTVVVSLAILNPWGKFRSILPGLMMGGRERFSNMVSEDGSKKMGKEMTEMMGGGVQEGNGTETEFRDCARKVIENCLIK